MGSAKKSCPDPDYIPVFGPELGRAINQKEKLVCRLEDQATWYARQTNALAFAWYAGTTLIILLGGITSLLIALGFAATPGWKRTTTIALPAIVALISTLLTQFKVREYYELREMGRIDALILATRAEAIAETEPAAVRDAVRRLELEALQLDRNQAAGFFGYLGDVNPRGGDGVGDDGGSEARNAGAPAGNGAAPAPAEVGAP